LETLVFVELTVARPALKTSFHQFSITPVCFSPPTCLTIPDLKHQGCYVNTITEEYTGVGLIKYIEQFPISIRGSGLYRSEAG